MIKLENHKIYGWEEAIRGMRNPMNSWDKSDTKMITAVLKEKQVRPGLTEMYYAPCEPYIKVGPNDLELMNKLVKAGTDHRKFMRMITVYVDITAPLYWWKEFDTYKVGTVANSCSTMHKIADKEFTWDDFSHEKLMVYADVCGTDDEIPYCQACGLYDSPMGVLEYIISVLNKYRNKYLETKNKPMKDNSKRATLMKKYWWQMIQLLPSSYNQKRTVQLNYEVLANIYKSRKNHKLDEWRYFCDWIKTLPYSELITGEEDSNV